MDDPPPAAALGPSGPLSGGAGPPRRAFVEAQAGALEPLAFIVVGLPEPPFDAIQVRHEADGTFVVEIAARDASSAFTADQEKGLGNLGFTIGTDTWVAPAAASPTVAVDLVEHVLDDVLRASADAAIDVRHGSVRDERVAEEKLAAMRTFIEPVLKELLGADAVIDEDGDYIADVHGSRVFVAPRAIPGRPPIIRVFAITNAGLTITPELGLFLARLNFGLAFGRFSIDSDHGAVWFDETLLGDHVSAEELSFVVTVVGQTAAEYDDKIGATFGGTFRQPGEVAAAKDAATAKPGEGGYL